MRPTTTFLIPNLHIYFVFNLVNTTTNTDKSYNIRSKWYNIYCIFRGDHDLINLLCLVVCRYESIFFFH